MALRSKLWTQALYRLKQEESIPFDGVEAIFETRHPANAARRMSNRLIFDV